MKRLNARGIEATNKMPEKMVTIQCTQYSNKSNGTGTNKIQGRFYADYKTVTATYFKPGSGNGIIWL
ncbi:hypothetical protein I5907_19345 [Panacibacter sp. DH6]|uniref:Uncharacterized protein n=1 Tax=Panacibacter microcysteis TaxID=2793269 RepID=A0A931GZX2_9BACT|nr:hypothetical protein [Panacibacter microcysteis]MBG9378402.1 hypothetical protein [Panacibacter microcysteis]